ARDGALPAGTRAGPPGAGSCPTRRPSDLYDYWALGHVHQRELLHADPPILFSGCLQGRHARETGPKGATIVSFNGRRPTLEEREIGRAQRLNSSHVKSAYAVFCLKQKDNI